LWDFWLPAFTCPHKVERIGTLGDGGKYVCGLERIERKKDCVVYSVGEFLLRYCSPQCVRVRGELTNFLWVGINGESSFEAAILERAPGCQVYGYDFSVKAVS
jgi:hypothetical protein